MVEKNPILSKILLLLASALVFGGIVCFVAPGISICTYRCFELWVEEEEEEQTGEKGALC